MLDYIEDITKALAGFMYIEISITVKNGNTGI